MSSAKHTFLSTSVHRRLGSCKSGCQATSLSLIVDVRKRIAELLGPYAEPIAWGLAVARVADIHESDLSAASAIEVWEAMPPNCFCELSDGLVKFDVLIDLYLTNVSRLVGDELLTAHLRRVLHT